MIRHLLAMLVALSLALGAAGCGKKGDLEDPENEKARFPRQYPR